MYLPPADLTSHIVPCSIVVDSHCRPSPQFLPADSTAVPFRTCTEHDPSGSSQYGLHDILQIILKTRRSWKTLKGQSEAVWPPFLEATMLKALQEYEPDDSRETRMLGRYPMRNRFISDYIHSTTGKYRSAKQVGSRLQQLRDTIEGRKLIDVLTRCYRPRASTGSCDARISVRQPTSWNGPASSPSLLGISCDSSSTPSSGFPIIPTALIMRRFQPQPRQPVESRMPVYIDILPQQSLSSSMGYNPSTPSASSASGYASRSSDAARHIRNIDPTVTFVSPCPVNGKSSYIVLLDGAPVHTEDTMLEYVGPYFASSAGQAPGDQPTLYNTALVPKYWDVLCEAADPTLYSIVQDVYRLPNHVPNQRHRPVRIFSATYHFKYPPMNASSTVPYQQSPIGVPSNGTSMTSVLGGQPLQGSMPMSIAPAMSRPMPSTHAIPTSEVEQNLFDEPFMLDVNFEQFAFDNFVSMDSTSYNM